MKIVIRRIGNSKALIIPTAILSQLGLKDGAELVVKDSALVIRPSKMESLAGWADASKALSAAGDDGLPLSEFGDANDTEPQRQFIERGLRPDDAMAAGEYYAAHEVLAELDQILSTARRKRS